MEDLGAVVVAEDLAAAAVGVLAAVVAVEEEAAIAAAVEAAAVADTRELQTRKTQVPSLRLFFYVRLLYTNSTCGLCGIMPALYPISRSFTTALFPSSP